jgi:hypothetical protein
VATSLEKTRKSLNVEKIIDPGLKSSGTLAQVLESPGISFQLCSDCALLIIYFIWITDFE